ncbi:winged helix-turn-helix transcriptional regulator [Actinomyces wuliandei]|uniref:winged helix-turn-helix transcriptional regulator n=1 Tax=Actinomyces wuliandei TaxID=2057743 RepID=UPI0013E39086|nr:helix-turn-helix domain-containing protein [Actinomyces wuliandei]
MGSYGAACTAYRDSALLKQLKELVEDDFLERTDHGEPPPRVDYRLTRRGESLRPLVQTMWDWSDMWAWSEKEFEFSQEEAEQMRQAHETLGVPQVRQP